MSIFLLINYLLVSKYTVGKEARKTASFFIDYGLRQTTPVCGCVPYSGPGQKAF
jgi:hypothetical protein